MSFKKKFIELCAHRGVAPTTVCQAIGLSNAAFSSWDENSIPRATTLAKLSAYFDVSIEYLKGEEEKPTAEGSELEEDVIIFCRNGRTVKKRLTKDQMAMLAAMVDAVVDDDDNN